MEASHVRHSHRKLDPAPVILSDGEWLLEASCNPPELSTIAAEHAEKHITPNPCSATKAATSLISTSHLINYAICT